MGHPVVMLHGWQGSQQSYGALADCLAAANYDVKGVWLASYATGEDDVDTRDLVRLFDRVLRQERLLDEKGKAGAYGPFTLITHSYGSVIVRMWMELYYQYAECPVKHHIMLAPSNFGSRLAPAGRRLPDAIFNLGREILKDLELGSHFLWDLNYVYVKSGKPEQAPFPFVLAGLTPYEDSLSYPKGRAERGSDGMVRASSANLNFVRINKKGESQDSPPTAFFTFPQCTHSGSRGLAGHIKSTGWEGDAVIERVLQCIKVESAADYRAMCEAYFPTDMSHAQIVVRVRDQYGRDVRDALVDFFVDDQRCSDFVLHTRSDTEHNSLVFYLDAKELKSRANTVKLQVTHRPYGHIHFGTGAQVVLFDRDSHADRLRGGRTTMVDAMLTRTTRGVRFDLSQSRPTLGPGPAKPAASPPAAEDPKDDLPAKP